MPTSRTSRRKKKRKKKGTSKPRVATLLSEKKIRTRVRELGREITRRYKGKELVLIGILKGSFVFLSDLAREIDLPLTCDFLRVSSYRNNATSGTLRFDFDTTQPITGKHVVIVEDIIDTGRTIKALLARLRPRRPRSLKVCTLLYKPERTVVRVPIEFLGFEIPDEFVVGYGLDYAGKYRNLRYIGALRK